MEKQAKIYVAGHNGMVGSAIVRLLLENGCKNIIFREFSELDLTNQADVAHFFEIEKPEYVFLAAAKVGGIHANNTYRAQFIYENLQIQNNIIHQSYVNGVKKLLFLGSSCIYPKNCPQPMTEEFLLTGTLEPTNEPYAIAKISGIKMCEAYREQYGCNFISVMPTNLYGPNDNYNLETSHVLPALIRKIHEAKIENKPFVEVWGSGRPLREFMYVEDMAAACIHLMETYDEKKFVNIGTGNEVSIKELAEIISKIVGYFGTLKFDSSKPDGTMRKLLNVSYLESLGYKSKISLNEGIDLAYKSYLSTL